MVFIIESKEPLVGELRTVVRDDGVQDSKAMDDVEEEQHGLLRLDHRDRPRFYPLCKLVYGDKQVGIASELFFERSNQIEPPDNEGPGDGDHLECLGQEVRLSSVVLAPFAGAYDLLGVGYCSGPVVALSKCVPNQGSRPGMVTTDPTVDITQQKLPLFDRATEL